MRVQRETATRGDERGAPAVAPLYLQPFRWAAVTTVPVYYRITYRIRGWGRLPRDRRGGTLVIANHQHELESAVIVSDLSLATLSWRYPIFTVSSRRMWEPGFMAERLPWLSPLLRTLNLGEMFSALGMQPIENELHVRPFVSLAYALHRAHGDLPLETVFTENARERLPPEVHTFGDLLSPKFFHQARERVKLTEVQEPYRKELLELTREELEQDIAHFEDLQRSGATIFLTPEGFYSGDGKMQRLRGILSRLAPLAQIWVVGISYDPFVGRRLSMLYRLEPAVAGIPLEIQIKRVRPVTASALLGTWLHGIGDAPFTASEARAAVEAMLQSLPANLFSDPELRRDPAKLVGRALAGLLRTRAAHREQERYWLCERRVHPQFPRTSDMIEYQFNFHQETLEGARFTP